MTATSLATPDLTPFVPDLNPAKAEVVVAEVLEAARQVDEGAYAGIFDGDFEWPQTAMGILRDAAIRRYQQTPPGRVDPEQALTDMFNSAELVRLRGLLSRQGLWVGAVPQGSFPDAPAAVGW